jgi:hypothetical protein
MIRQVESDSVIAEIHRARREISERFKGDIAAIAEDAARRQAAAGRPVWRSTRDKPIEDLADASRPR